MDEETNSLDTRAGLVRVKSTPAEKDLCRDICAAWRWNLQLFLHPVFSVCALVLKTKKKELDDKKFLPEERYMWNESDVKEWSR